MSSSSLSEEPAGDITWSLQYRVTAQTLKKGEKGFDITPTHLIRSEEALSSLYSFELKQESVGRDAANMLNAWLGKRVELTISLQKEYDGGSKTDETKIRTVYGIVTSVTSGPVESYEQFSSGWYTLTIEPEFSAACYSRNRAVYLSDAAPTMTEDAEEPEVSSKKDKDDMRCKVLLDIADRWNTVCVVSPDAKKRIPDYLQLVQNDESDYNFFCRLLSTWGLGYCWKMDESKDVKKEYIYVYDVLGGENPNQEEEDAEKKKTGTPVEPLTCMCSRGGGLRAWRLNRGYHSLDMEKVGVQNYLGAFSSGTADANRLLLSLHDETWDQLQSKATDKAAYGKWHFLNRHFNAGDVHGTYAYCCEGSNSDDERAHLTSVLQLRMSAKVTWAPIAGAPEEAQPYNLDTSPYFLTRRVMTGDRWKIKMDFSGRAPQEIIVAKATKEGEEDTTQTIGGGILPRPLTPNADPDLDEDAPLLKEAAWESPKPRTFMAVVTSNVPHNYQGRNFCRVRELNGEEMWVEMGSPNADSNSGIFARPRKDNVLFCMDRGDLSIPIVLSSMFRGKDDAANTLNAAPAVKLKTMERHTRTENGTIDENSALTLRSRTHEPQRSDEEGNDLDVHDRDITSEDLEFVQRPQSVKNLAEQPKPFSQIQMFSMDNGVRPIPQDDNISNVFAVDPVFETVAGFLSETDLTVGYPLCDAADAMQTANNVPITRPHLQGISMYSAGDMINQSADHQIMNAGGEIVLTAAQAITLRVGKSVIRISEYGIEMSSNAGLVHRTGAYPAYHTEDNAQNVDVLSGKTVPLAGGSIMVNNAGVYSRGPYIANTAVNMFTANTILGSAFTLSDFSGRLYAPAVEIIGGAALEKTATSIWKDAIFGVDDTLKPWNPDPVYTGTLEDGYKMKGYNGSSVAKGCVNETLNIIGEGISAVADLGKNVANLFQPEGSMIKMLPERMVFSSLARFDYSSTTTNVSSAAAGFIATAENSSFFGGNASSKFATFKTLYTWGSGFLGIFESIYDLATSSGSGDSDTFSADNCDVKKDPKAPGGKDFNASDGWYLGEAVVGALAGLLSLINPVEAMANLLFGRRKDDALGLIAEEKLTATVTSANTNQVVAAKTQAATNVLNATGALEQTLASEIETVASANSSLADKNLAVANIGNAIANYVDTVQNSNNVRAAVTTTENVANKVIAMEIKA